MVPPVTGFTVVVAGVVVAGFVVAGVVAAGFVVVGWVVYFYPQAVNARVNKSTQLNKININFFIIFYSFDSIQREYPSYY
jgi:hypothetical protein